MGQMDRREKRGGGGSVGGTCGMRGIDCFSSLQQLSTLALTGK